MRIPKIADKKTAYNEGWLYWLTIDITHTFPNVYRLFQTFIWTSNENIHNLISRFSPTKKSAASTICTGRNKSHRHLHHPETGKLIVLCVSSCLFFNWMVAPSICFLRQCFNSQHLRNFYSKIYVTFYLVSLDMASTSSILVTALKQTWLPKKFSTCFLAEVCSRSFHAYFGRIICLLLVL